MTYCGKRIIDYVFESYEDGCNRVILVTEDGMTYTDYMSDVEFDRLTDDVAEGR